MKKNRPKGPSRRQLKKNSSVDPQYNLKSRQEEINDINEYYHTLSPADQEWMNTYSEEFISAKFKHDLPKKVLNKDNAEMILRNYIKNLKNKKEDLKTRNFVNKFLIKKELIPLEVIKDLFFETDEKKLLKLIKTLKAKMLGQLKKVSIKEIRKLIKEIQKDVYQVNNARNRCILTREKAQGALNYLYEINENNLAYNDEDLIIDRIDSQKIDDSIKNLDKTFDQSDDDSDETDKF